MNMQANKPLIPKHTSTSSRIALAAVLLAVLALAVLAGSALAAALVKNGSFEKDSNGDGIPDNWTPDSLTSSDKRVCNQSHVGACSFKMVGDGDAKFLYQVIDISGLAGDEFTLKAWTKGKNIVEGGIPTARAWIQFNPPGYPDGYYYVFIPPGNTPWTLRQLTVPAPEDYDSVTIGVEVLFTTSGKVWFDKVKLVGP